MSHAGTGSTLDCVFAPYVSKRKSGFPELSPAGFEPVAARAGRGLFAFSLRLRRESGTVPVHIWLPEAHPVAPSNVSALMSGIVIKTGIYGMARVFFDFYGAPPIWMGTVVLALGVVSALLGVL